MKHLVRTLVQILIATFLMSLLHQLADANCYKIRECSCESKLNDGITINCRNENLESFPLFIVPPEYSVIDHSELNLAGNLITSIGDNAFSRTGLKVKRIILFDDKLDQPLNNPITYISDTAFAGLENILEVLVLQLGSGMNIPVGALKNLVNLKVLRIYNYQYTSLPPGALSTLVNLEHVTFSKQVAVAEGGALHTLDVSDFAHQKKLVSLDLKNNGFQEIPSIFKTSLGNLSQLCLESNSITSISAGAFQGLVNLQSLDLSQNPFDMTIDGNAFLGLEMSLQSLTCGNCHLRDEQLSAFKTLRSLKELKISSNVITSIDVILKGMKSLQSLQLLDVQSNKITTLNNTFSNVMYKDMTNSLEVLDLSSNPLTVIPADTFVSLKQLRIIQLNDIRELQLDPNAFQAQQTTLRTLSLIGSKFELQDWAVIGNLTALQVLALPKCKISSIPEYAFEKNSQLQDIDLSDNQLSSVTQRNFVGLQNSLSRLVLNRNNLQTLNECVFYQFKSMDFNKFGLNSNPLQCNCALKWLFTKLEPHVASQGNVECDDKTLFLDKKNYFLNCSVSNVQCEVLTTPIIPGETTDSVQVDKAGLSMQAIIGIAVGAGAAFIIILILAVVCHVRRSRKRARHAVVTIRPGDETKHYKKRNSEYEVSPRRPAEPGGQSVARPVEVDGQTAEIVQTIVTMTDEEKYRLINLLTNSSGSIGDLDSDTPGRRPYVRAGKYNTMPSMTERHLYEEIPADHINDTGDVIVDDDYQTAALGKV